LLEKNKIINFQRKKTVLEFCDIQCGQRSF
jgi:hypothetical protein